MPPGADAAPVTWRSLLALGISGGLLPCPSALVVMLGAIALNRIALGLLLIVVFSLGLAGTLTIIGVLMVHARGLFARAATGDRWWGRLPLKFLPAISALFILIAGIGIVLAALAQAGVLRA
jgi:ABC-type nickel/cobalt efflux system permease component RcnA